MTTESSTYQGWKNYPTWCINLWISNEEPLYREWVDMVHRALHEGQDAYDLGDTLKDWAEEIHGPNVPEGYIGDLFQYALDQVDWREIAETWLVDEKGSE